MPKPLSLLFAMVFVLILMFISLYPLCSGQTVVRNCNLINCSRVNEDICATNGRQCRRFSDACSLESANCNATISSVWNRTDTVQCLNLRVNATGLCSCPALGACSNRTSSAGICVHRDGHTCRLFRTECDLARARCNRETWHHVDSMQCRGFDFNQTRTCTCPKSLRCSRNETQLCVKVDADICRLYDNECDLEGARCRGERLVDVNNTHCEGFPVGINATCTCPGLLTCQRNATNLCVRDAANRCQLVRNECDLEQQKCNGSVLVPTLALQCRNIAPGQTGNCECPSLATCSINSTNICVRTRVGCRLKANECELERARCLGEVMVGVSPVQCSGFSAGDSKPCRCPRLDTCNRNNTNICVRSAEGCMLMRNECELEQARCEERNFTVVDNIQCNNFTFNQLRNCSCPLMGACAVESANICVAVSGTHCKLLPNRCEVEKARCQGEVLNITNPLHCHGLPMNIPNNCFCPLLRNCSRTASQICVRESSSNNTCSILGSHCELEQAKCEGRNIVKVDNLYCRNFTNTSNRTCFCPSLETCNRNSSSVCVTNTAQCRLLQNECELEQAKCEGSEFIATRASQCLNFRINQQSNCSCPNLFTCAQNSTTICVRTRNGCKLLSSQCDLEESLCTGEALRTVDMIHCQGFRSDQERSCSCPSLKTCSRNSSSVCVRNIENNCTLLRSECDVALATCQGQVLKIVPKYHCSNFTFKNTRNCVCPNLFNCTTNATETCVKLPSGSCKLLRNQCEVEYEKCHGQAQTISPLHCIAFGFGETRNCSCPNLKTCAQNNSTRTNICVGTPSGCRHIRNECELEQLRCLGHNLTILPSIHCKFIQPGNESSCACPNLLRCQRNSSSVCIETQRGCMLQNQCDLEQRLCQGESVNVTNMLQCQGFLQGEQRSCVCPELNTCSKNSTAPLCVRNEQNCTLMANSCDLAMAKCKGEKWCLADIEECRNVAAGQIGTCSCAQLQNCSQSNATSVCVNLGRACQVMANQCELEKAKCRGQAWTPTNAIQCRREVQNQWHWCACPRLLNCCDKHKPFCVSGPRGCKLIKSDCDLQLARCQGEVWSRTDDLQCMGFELGQSVRNCTCPKLTTCTNKLSPNDSSEICVRNIKGCTLLRDNCEFERSLCNGDVWQHVDDFNCQDFPLYHTRPCRCPALEYCSNATSVCGRDENNQCYKFKSECDMRWADCIGAKLSLTSPERCQGLEFGEDDECKCPESRNCNRQRRICGRREDTCKLFRNECDLNKSNCRDENWQYTSRSNCCQFNVNEIKSCTRNLTSTICAQVSNNRCRLFTSRCDFNEANALANNDWSIVHSSNCKCLRTGRTGLCARRIVCEPTSSRNRRVCGRQGRTYRLFRSRCHLRLHNYQVCANFRAVRISRCRTRIG